MLRKLLDSLRMSLEWRIIAYFITNMFLWVTTHSFWKAAGLALLLQVILFLVHTLWYFWRCELRMPLFPQLARRKEVK